MLDLLLLPLRVARWALDQVLGEDDTAPPPAQAPPAAARPKATPKPKPKPKPRAKPKPQPKPEPAPEPLGGSGPGPGPTIEVAAPWDGYDTMTEDAILERLIGADPALRAIVRLYESEHGGRRQILLATEEVHVQP